jgi:hypothetical protein
MKRLPEGLSLEQGMEIIFQHQKACEKQGNYVEAEVARRKVQELRQQTERDGRQELKDRHAREREDAERAHLGQLASFASEWDSLELQFRADIEKI